MDINTIQNSIFEYFVSPTRDGCNGILQDSHIVTFSEYISNAHGISNKIKRRYDYRVKQSPDLTTRQNTSTMMFAGRYKFYTDLEADIKRNEIFRNIVCQFIKDIVNPFFGRNF